MCTSFKLKSHIYENKSSQLLVEHLRGVARIAKETSQLNGIDDKEIMNVIEILGLCHDFGKASSYFQKYLEGKYNGDLKKHGEISAYFTYYMLPERWKLIGFICVKRHHGNIDIENNSFFATENEEVLKEISKDIKSNIEELKLIYKCDLEKFFSKMGDGTLIKEVKLAFIKRTSTMKRKTIKEQQQEFMWLQYLWSLLLTGDKTQLITGKTFKNIQGLSERFTLNYKNNIRKSLIERIPVIEKSPLFNIR